MDSNERKALIDELSKALTDKDVKRREERGKEILTTIAKQVFVDLGEIAFYLEQLVHAAQRRGEL